MSDPYETRLAVMDMLAEMRRTRFVPNEDRDRDHRAQLAFDYGYQQALLEVGARLYLAIPDVKGASDADAA